MIYRSLTQKITSDLAFFPIVAVVGPRQTGKTTLASVLELPDDKQFLYLDLEWEEDRIRLTSDAGAYLLQNEHKCVIIDEVQILPGLFPILRSLVDRKREAARFMLLGSASPELLRNSAESLAGRIAYHELTPFLLSEIWDAQVLRKHWFRGGFPNAFLAPDDELAKNWLQQFTTTFIERDLVQVIGKEANAGSMLRFMRMLGHLHGQILNASDISRNLNIATQTVSRYLDLLETAFLIRRLEPYYVNMGKRLIKSPKFYYRDSGIYHSITRIRSMEELYTHPGLGASWEGYVIEEIYRTAGKNCEYFYYRTVQGAEVDLVLLTPKNEKVCIEIKHDNIPSVSKGFFNSLKDLNPDYSFVITPEATSYQRSDGVYITNIRDFLHKYLPDMCNG